MKRTMMPLPILMVCAFAFSAYADPIQPEEEQFHLCKVASIKDWGDPKEIEQQVQDMGYTLIGLTIEKGCWEAKVYDDQKEVYELYIHPKSKEVILHKHKVDETKE
jgi:hypothetical protein